MRLEVSAERKLASRSRKELSQKATRLPSVQLPNLDIRMIPKKTLVVKEQEQSPILSKNLGQGGGTCPIGLHRQPVAHILSPAVRPVTSGDHTQPPCTVLPSFESELREGLSAPLMSGQTKDPDPRSSPRGPQGLGPLRCMLITKSTRHDLPDPHLRLDLYGVPQG